MGHSLADLLDGYPATAVKGLALAARLHRRILLAELVSGMTVAVAGALDLALNQGKGRVLEKWYQEVLPNEPEQQKGPKKITDRAFSFFTGMPRKSGG